MKSKVCIGILTVVLFALLSAKQVLAAEALRVDDILFNRFFEIDSEDMQMYQTQYASATELYDGYQEILPDDTDKRFRYDATEDVDITLWISDITGGYTSDKTNFRLDTLWSGGYIYQSSLFSENTNDPVQIHLKKGESLYIRAYDTGDIDGTFTLHCSVKKSQAIKSVSIVRSVDKGYLQEGATFDLRAIATRGVVKVTYADGSSQQLRIGYNYSWTVDMQPIGYDKKVYPYTVYYRGYPIALTYELKSYADEISLTPVTTATDIEVTYNAEDEYAGYSFVPQKTGLYNIYGDATEGDSLDVLIYEKNGRAFETNYIFGSMEQVEIYMMAGVEYQIYIKKPQDDLKVTFWIEDCLEYIEEGMTVEIVERQWYTGEAICPEPAVSYKGQNVNELGTVGYEYIRNRQPGMAAVFIKYRFWNEATAEYLEGKIRIPFAIKATMQSAQIEIPSYTYTGKEIVPDEKVTWDGKVLTRGVDYTIECTNHINAGNAVMLIKGIGDYEGTITQTYVIEKAIQEIQVKDTVITHKGAKKFSLKARAQGKLTYSGGKKKIASVDQKGKVTAKGYGKVNITVKAAETKNYKAATKTVSIVVTSKTSKVQSVKSKAKRKMTVRVKKATGAHGYEISYSTDKNFATGVKTRTTKKCTVTIMKLSSRKTYYVRVRSYRKVKGQKLYSDYSSARKVKVK